jgi:hypothetical protein
MKEEICKWIKQQVYQYIAPANYGRVILSEVYRLFSDYGPIQDLEKCMDTFVKNGFASKTTDENGSTIYVFKDIAVKFERQWRENLEDLLVQKGKMLKEKERREILIRVLNDIHSVWSNGWRGIGDWQVEASIRNYISIFWNDVIKEVVDSLKRMEGRIKQVDSEIKKLKNLLGET